MPAFFNLNNYSVHPVGVISEADFAHFGFTQNGVQNRAIRDPGVKARALTPGSRVADFCFQIIDLDKKRPRDDKTGVS